MAEEWREFEELVSRIERILGPIGAVVTSPDRIRDSVTGKLRDVDASIRPQKDAPPVRVLECRDRAGVQDVTWIEQIIGKTLGHGVPTIAVSSTGFSKSAVTKANHYGIETRVISTLTQEEMIRWVRIVAVEHVIFHPRIEERVFLWLYPETDDPNTIDLHPSVYEQIQAGGGDAPVLLSVKDGRMFRVGEILDLVIRSGQIRFPESADNQAELRTAIIKFDRALFKTQTVVGPRDVSRLEIRFRLGVETTSSPLPAKGFSYHGAVRPTVHGIETQTEVLGNQILVSIHQEPGSNMFAVTVTKKDKQ
jgi:hypothetical protein